MCLAKRGSPNVSTCTVSKLSVPAGNKMLPLYQHLSEFGIVGIEEHGGDVLLLDHGDNAHPIYHGGTGGMKRCLRAPKGCPWPANLGPGLRRSFEASTILVSDSFTLESSLPFKLISY